MQVSKGCLRLAFSVGLIDNDPIGFRYVTIETSPPTPTMRS